MGQTPDGSTQKPKKKPFWSFLMWWKTDPAEIETQVANYDSLVFWQSARGISMVLCLLSAAVTGAFSPFLDLSREALVAHVVTCAGLGFAMFRGKKWAFVAGMVLWTLESGSLVVDGVGAARAPIMPVIWWCIYMSAFILAFRVEQARNVKGAGGTHPAPVGPSRRDVPTPLGAKPIGSR